MSRFGTSIGLSLITLVLTAHRLPAPIIEEERSTPAPAPQQSEAPKPKHSPRPTTTEQSSSPTETRAKPAPASASQGPARFAGTWTGKVNQGLLGHVATSFTIDSSANSVELSHNLGGGTKRATITGNSISWKSGVAGEVTWMLTPNSDGQTAQVNMKGTVLSDTTTFRRGQKASQ